MTNKVIDNYNKIMTNSINKTINENKNWQNAIADFKPLNVSGEKPVPYNGVNAINLALSSNTRGDKDNRFMTRRQAENSGFSIKEDAKALAVSYLSPVDREITDKKTGEVKSVKIPFTKIAYVYNGKDIEGLGKAKDFTKSNSKETATNVYKKVEKAIKENYVNDSKDLQSFKTQMATALICQKEGIALDKLTLAKMKPFNTDFLKDAKQGMKQIRSSAKIADYVHKGKEFEKFNTKAENVKAVDGKAKQNVKAKPTTAKERLAQRKLKSSQGRSR